MALALDYTVTICDPREEYADGWLVPGTQLVRTMPDDTVVEFKPDKHTADRRADARPQAGRPGADGGAERRRVFTSVPSAR